MSDEQVKGRALSKDEKEAVDIAQKVLDCLESEKDVRCDLDPGSWTCHQIRF